MAREFVVDSRVFPDPDPSKSPDEVRQLFQDFFPELVNAQTRTSKKEDGTEVVEFVKTVGTKG
jgi:PRTRC genetic system protein C